MTSSYQWHTTRLAAASCVLLVFVALAPATLAGQRAPSLMLVFEAATPDDATARDGYQTIWAQEGTRIVAALRSHTGLEFQEADNTVHVVVVEEPSSSGFGSRPMRLRSSYSTDTKRATLIHELGHRLGLALGAHLELFACRLVGGCPMSVFERRNEHFSAA